MNGILSLYNSGKSAYRHLTLFALLLPGLTALSQGNLGQSLYFDGNTYVDLGAVQLPKNALTIELFFKNDQTTAVNASFVARRTFGGPYEFLPQSLVVENNNTVIVSNPYRNTVLDREWYHLAAVYDGTSASYYINGCLVSSVAGAITGFANPAYTTILGFNRAVNVKLSGTMDEVRIWNRGRTQQEIVQDMYGISNPQAEQDLVAYYKFEGNLLNEMGNGYNGTPNGSPVYVQTGNLTVPVVDNFGITTTDVSCVNTNDGRVQVTNPYRNSTLSLDGGPFTSTSQYSNLSPGNHTLTLRSEFGCTAQQTFTINDVPTAGLTATANPNPVCNGQTLSFNATINGSSAGVTYSWSGPAGYSGTGATPPPITNTTVANTGNYTVTAVYNNCTATDIVTVAVGNNPPKPDAGPDMQVCEFNDIQLSATSAISNVSYSWTGPMNFVSTVIRPVLTRAQLSNSGPYVVVTSDGGCLSNPDTVVVTVQPLPVPLLGNDTVICPGEPINLFPGSYISYDWQDGSGNPILTVNEAGIYHVEVEDQLGCIGEDSIVIREFCPFENYTPNTFTPDNDGYNDFFLITANNVVQFEMNIYNRWGEVIFYTTDIQNGWDGKYLGQIVETGVYAVQAKLKVVDQFGATTDHLFLGNVTVLR